MTGFLYKIFNMYTLFMQFFEGLEIGMWKKRNNYQQFLNW